MSAGPGRRAAFLDRDGVLIEEVGHLRSAAQLRLLPGAAAAVRRLREAGLLVIVVTNQSAVARGLLSEAELAGVHERLVADLAAEGAAVDAIYYCPHHPTEGVGAYGVGCDCRKPAPGLLLRARDELGLDLGRSWLVGDKSSDIAAARAAGCAAILVRTGHGEAEIAAGALVAAPPDEVCADVLEAAARIVAAATGVGS